MLLRAKGALYRGSLDAESANTSGRGTTSGTY